VKDSRSKEVTQHTSSAFEKRRLRPGPLRSPPLFWAKKLRKSATHASVRAVMAGDLAVAAMLSRKGRTSRRRSAAQALRKGTTHCGELSPDTSGFCGGQCAVGRASRVENQTALAMPLSNANRTAHIADR
jgi:hypothetical protein